MSKPRDIITFGGTGNGMKFFYKEDMTLIAVASKMRSLTYITNPSRSIKDFIELITVTYENPINPYDESYVFDVPPITISFENYDIIDEMESINTMMKVYRGYVYHKASNHKGFKKFKIGYWIRTKKQYR